MSTKKILAKLPDGRKVFHGELKYGVFSRRIPHRYMRFSDMSFCLNEAVLPELKERNCDVLQFVWLKANEKVIYRIALDRALASCKFVTNEYGESNLRIPVEECMVFNRIKLPKNSIRIPKKHRPKAPAQEDVQRSLF